MIVDSLESLYPCHRRAVIINYNTKLVSTLAVLSVLRYAGMPLVLVDCESTDGSYDHFKELSARHDFDLVSMPLREHGETLDHIFSIIPSDIVLAVDSDLEILEPSLVEFFCRYIDHSCVYGCGFRNGPGYLLEDTFRGSSLEGALFDERFWMPFVMLKVAPVREALSQGVSFASRAVDNEYSLLRIPLRLRRLSVFRRLFKSGPCWLRHPYHTTLRPSKVYHDTGSLMDHHLRYQQNLYFVGLPESVHGLHVNHYFGTTRNEIDPAQHGGGGTTAIANHVRARLRSEYSLQM